MIYTCIRQIMHWITQYSNIFGECIHVNRPDKSGIPESTKNSKAMSSCFVILHCILNKMLIGVAVYNCIYINATLHKHT